MTKLTDLEDANLALRGRKTVEDAKNLLRENITTVVTRPAPLTPEEQYAERILTEQLEEGMELLATEARESLALNAMDEIAQRQLLQYEQWKRTKNKPAGTTIIRKGQRCPGQRATGVWTRTRDFGWLLKVSGKSAVGDVVNVRRKGGTTESMKLTEEVAPGYFKGQAV
jgi:hypothetical protein